MSQSLIAIVDGDILLYRICFSIDPEAELYVVKAHCDQYLNNLFMKVGCTAYIGIIGIHGSNNPKYSIAPDYKRGRPTDKPPHWNTVINYLISKWGFSPISGCETDDAIDLCASRIENHIVVSSDKDLLQIPGKHFIMGVMRKGKVVREDKTVNITKEQAKKQFYTQMLTGDTVDNVSAIYGIGPKKAEKLLDSDSMDKVVIEQYKKAFGENWQIKLGVNAALLGINGDFAWDAGFVVPKPVEYRFIEEDIGY
jgi:hypothetical protein